MKGQTIILRGPSQREFAHRLIEAAPVNAVLNIREAKRTIPQNDKMWAMLSDISRTKPDGRKHLPEIWKCMFMSALGYECRFEMGLDDKPFPIGFKTSDLTVQGMSDLIEFMYEYGARTGVVWMEPE